MLNSSAFSFGDFAVEGYDSVESRMVVKYCFMVFPEHLRVIFERSFDLCEVHFMFSSIIAYLIC